ncbi:MAG: hypothetical protein R3E79_50790 [Caldilineaceae bacterium]
MSHKSWLLITAIIVGALGPVFALGTGRDGGTRPLALDLLSWPLDGQQTFASPTRGFYRR